MDQNYSMFLEKVKGQSDELQRVRQLNYNLKLKEANLKKEREKLEKKMIENNIQSATNNENLITAQNDLAKGRKTYLQSNKALEVAGDFVDLITSVLNTTSTSLNTSLTELQPIKETLTFKDQVVDCLQNYLHESRLKLAEDDVVIKQLKQELNNLERDMRILKTQNPSEIRYFQEEFLQTKMREAETLREFDVVRKNIEDLKENVEKTSVLNVSDDEEDVDDWLKINFKFWGEDKSEVENLMIEKEKVSNNVNTLEEEADRLKIEIENLSGIIEDLSKKTYFGKNVLLGLKAKIENTVLKKENTNKEITKIQEKYNTLKQKFDEKENEIQNSINRKTDEIECLNNKCEKIEKTSTPSLENFEEKTVKLLESQIVELERRISMYCKNV